MQNKTELKIVNSDSENLGRCYNAYHYTLESSHKPTVEECKALCGSGNFNNGSIKRQSLNIDGSKWVTMYSYHIDSGG